MAADTPPIGGISKPTGPDVEKIGAEATKRRHPPTRPADPRLGSIPETRRARSVSRSKGQRIQTSPSNSVRCARAPSGKPKGKPARRRTRTHHFPPPAYPETEQIIRTRSDCPEMPSFA